MRSQGMFGSAAIAELLEQTWQERGTRLGGVRSHTRGPEWDALVCLGIVSLRWWLAARLKSCPSLNMGEMLEMRNLGADWRAPMLLFSSSSP